MADYRDRIPEFQRDIVANPLDQSIWLILADWLKEHNDPRGEMVQVQYELRNEPSASHRSARQVANEKRMLELHHKRINGCLPRWDGIVGMPFVFIPPGVGCPKPFWMAACTVSRFHTFRIHPTYDPIREEDYNPLTNVSFRQAQMWCRLFSDDKAFSPNGERFRLPTELEWQYACRAGTTTSYWWGDHIVRGLVNCRHSSSGPQPDLENCLSSRRPNPFGLHHVHGNVWEWCEISKPRNRPHPSDGNIAMGGSYNVTPDDCKSNSFLLTEADRDVGFRMAFDVVGS